VPNVILFFEVQKVINIDKAEFLDLDDGDFRFSSDFTYKNEFECDVVHLRYCHEIISDDEVILWSADDIEENVFLSPGEECQVEPFRPYLRSELPDPWLDLEGLKCRVKVIPLKWSYVESKTIDLPAAGYLIATETINLDGIVQIEGFSVTVKEDEDDDEVIVGVYCVATNISDTYVECLDLASTVNYSRGSDLHEDEGGGIPPQQSRIFSYNHLINKKKFKKASIQLTSSYSISIGSESSEAAITNTL
jgi:hypothetical protein